MNNVCMHNLSFPSVKSCPGKTREKKTQTTHCGVMVECDGGVVVVTQAVFLIYTSTHNRLERTDSDNFRRRYIYCSDILKLEIKPSQRIYTDECSLETRCVLKSNSMKQTIWGLRRVQPNRQNEACRDLHRTDGRTGPTKEDESSHHVMFFLSRPTIMLISRHTGDR